MILDPNYILIIWFLSFYMQGSVFGDSDFRQLISYGLPT